MRWRPPTTGCRSELEELPSRVRAFEPEGDAAALPDLLQLRVIQERQDYADDRPRVEARDQQHEILGRLAGDGSPLGLPAGWWLASAQVDSRLEAEARRALWALHP